MDQVSPTLGLFKRKRKGDKRGKGKIDEGGLGGGGGGGGGGGWGETKC